MPRKTAPANTSCEKFRLAARGKTSRGWFYGLKLHFVINHKGEIMALKITPGNTADSAVLNDITKHLAGKLYADKGYLGQELFQKLWRRGLPLITGIRRNRKNYLLPLADKLMLRKRFLIETVRDTLQSEMGLEHSRHRSPINAMVHVLSCLAAYTFRPGKPAISVINK
jgi:IS5 family transposase